METFSAQLALCAGNSPVPVNSPHKGQWRGSLMFSLICGWVNNREAGDLRRHRGHYNVNVIIRMPAMRNPCVSGISAVTCNYVFHTHRSNPFHQNGLTLIPAWISSYILYKVCDEISYPFPNFNGCTVEIWEWISKFQPTLYLICDYLCMLWLKFIHVNKRDPMSIRW